MTKIHGPCSISISDPRLVLGLRRLRHPLVAVAGEPGGNASPDCWLPTTGLGAACSLSRRQQLAAGRGGYPSTPVKPAPIRSPLSFLGAPFGKPAGWWAGFHLPLGIADAFRLTGKGMAKYLVPDSALGFSGFQGAPGASFI